MRRREPATRPAANHPAMAQPTRPSAIRPCGTPSRRPATRPPRPAAAGSICPRNTHSQQVGAHDQGYGQRHEGHHHERVSPVEPGITHGEANGQPPARRYQRVLGGRLGGPHAFMAAALTERTPSESPHDRRAGTQPGPPTRRAWRYGSRQGRSTHVAPVPEDPEDVIAGSCVQGSSGFVSQDEPAVPPGPGRSPPAAAPHRRDLRGKAFRTVDQAHLRQSVHAPRHAPPERRIPSSSRGSATFSATVNEGIRFSSWNTKPRCLPP